MEEEVLFNVENSFGIITLNRPKTLNALTMNMIEKMRQTFTDWMSHDDIKAVIIKGAGDRAFCAGGDIRALYDWGKSNDKKATGFYYEEYQLNQLIKSYSKPYASFVNGIVMGGGVGVSVHGAFRVAGENYSFAMPETGIGLFPDCLLYTSDAADE